MSQFQDEFGAWRKSTYSDDHRDCVEVACDDGGRRIRDSKNRDGGSIAVSPGSWTQMTARLRHGAEY